MKKAFYGNVFVKYMHAKNHLNFIFRPSEVHACKVQFVFKFWFIEIHALKNLELCEKKDYVYA